MFSDNLMNEAMLSAFIRSELDSNSEVIDDVSASAIERLIETENYVVVIACEF